MKFAYLKQKIRGWLPPQPSPYTRLRHYSVPIAVGLAIAVLSISLFVVSSTFLFSPATVKPMPIADQGNSTNPTVEPTPTTLPTSTPTPKPTSSQITEDKALKIAMPVITQYAQENGRTIESVNATLAHGLWVVRADFVWGGIPHSDDISDSQLWIYGYVVDIQPESGQITYSCPQGIM